MSNMRRPADGLPAKKTAWSFAGVLMAIMVMWVIGADPAMAQSVTTSTPLETFTSEEAYTLFNNPYGDPFTSVFLNQLFGDLFPTVADNGSDNVFSSIIGYFNIITLVVGGMLFFYNVTVGVMQSAHEGSILGRNWSSLWAPIRVLFAVGLMVPLPNLGGYNLAQSGVAFIVRGSTMMATTVWKASAELVVSGRVAVASAPGTIDPEVMKTLYLNTACKAIVDYQMLAASGGSKNFSTGAVTYGSTPPLYVDYVTEVGIAGSPSEGSAKNISALWSGSGAGRQRLETNICGSYASPVIPSYIDRINGSDTNNTSMVSDQKRRNLELMFRATHEKSMNDVRDAMIAVTDQMLPSAMDPNAVMPNIAPQIASAITDANATIASGTNQVLDSALGAYREGGDARDAMIARIGGNCDVSAKTTEEGLPVKCYSEGWIGAGSWYMMIAQLNNEISTLTEARSSAERGSYLASNALGGGADNRALFIASGGNAGWFRKGDAQQFADAGMMSEQQANLLMARYEQAWADSVPELAALGFELPPEDLDGLNDSVTNADNTFLKIPGFAEVLNRGVEGIVSWSSPSNAGNDPMIGIMDNGKFLLRAAGIIMVGAAVGSAFVGAGLAIMLAPFVCLLVTAGSLMNFVLPMLPFFYWVLAVTGYFLLIAEAIVAVNLWALAHMRMDGDGISGQAGQYGWLMFLSLLVTPVLMVFGFLLGMGIFRVTSALIDIGINQALSGILSGGLYLKFIAVIIYSIFMSVIYIVLLERSFSLVSEFPGKVLRWMGASSELTSGEEGRARMAAAGAASATYGAAGGITKQLGKGGQAIGDKNSKKGDVGEGGSQDSTPKPGARPGAGG